MDTHADTHRAEFQNLGGALLNQLLKIKWAETVQTGPSHGLHN